MDLKFAGAHHPIQLPSQPPFEDGPRVGDEQKKSHGIGEDTRGYENYTGDENEDAVYQLFCRDDSLSNASHDLTQGSQPFQAGEQGAQDACNHDKENRVKRTQIGTYLYQDVQLGDGNDCEQQE